MNNRYHRSAFSAFEIVTCLAVLAVAGILISQLATWMILERTSQENRERAVALAENTLETARTINGTDLTAWVEKQSLPKNLAERWPQGQMKVSVTPEKEQPALKRVTVVVRWTAETTSAPSPITLSAWVTEAPR